MSTVVNPEDRATAVLFGDGTVLIEHVEDESVGILDHVCHMNGEGESSLYIPAGGSVKPASAASVGERRHYVVQDGPAAYKAAVIGMAEVTEEILKRNDMTAADLAWLVPHQANRRIIEAVAKRLGLGLDRVIINLDRYGNTVAATIPIALSEWNEREGFAHGDRVVLSAFGAGFTAGSVFSALGDRLEHSTFAPAA
jgi:3-oxoacyl-[acyl-carrier-protein] synthase III